MSTAVLEQERMPAILDLHREELAKNLSAVVKAIQVEGPLSCREIEMLCQIGSKAASFAIRRLLEARIIERHRVTRIVKKEPRRVASGKYVLSVEYRNCRIKFDPVEIACGKKPELSTVCRLGHCQKAMLTEMAGGPKSFEELRCVVPESSTREVKRSLRKLAERGLVRLEDGRWVLV